MWYAIQRREGLSMAKIIAVAAQKGGSGKTATTSAIGAALREKKQRVLFVDADPQGSLTNGFIPDPPETGGLYDVLTGKLMAAQAIISTTQGDIIPGTDWLMNWQPKTAHDLRNALTRVHGNYDYILIDCGPSLGTLTANVLTAADWLIVPVRADFYALGTLRLLASTIYATQTASNPGLKIAGILITQFRARTVINRDMTPLIDRAAQALHTKVFRTYIRDCVKVAEAPAMQQSLLKYAPHCTAADDYRAITAELLKIIRKEAA